jgi:hypothetical protein
MFGFETFEQIREYVAKKETLYKAIQDKDDDQIVITRYGEYYETVKRETTDFYHEGIHWTIGLMKDSEETE